MAHAQLLLLEDIRNVGRSGDIVKVRAGFARNWLIPQKKAVVADKAAKQRQAKLLEEREKRAAADRKEAEEMAKRLEGILLSTRVKVDPEGKPYGSVSYTDVIDLLKANHSIAVERKNILLKQPLKALGTHTIPLRLKEGVDASVRIEIQSEEEVKKEGE